MNENRPENVREHRAEKIKSREVFTDDVEVIGSSDETEVLEALPIYCAVLTAAMPEQQVAGIAHLSLDLKAEGVAAKISELKIKLETKGVQLSASQIRLLNAGDILSAEINAAIGFKIDSEIIPAEYQGVRVNKKTGEVTFFTTFPEGQE